MEVTKENFHETVFEDETSENLSNESKPTLNQKIVNVTQKQEEEIPVETNKVNEPEQDVSKELPKSDKPKEAFDDLHFQKIADQRLTKLTKVELENEQLKAELNQLKNPQKPVEELRPPVEPVMPAGYNEIDAIADPNGVYGQAKQAYDKYLKEVITYQGKKLDKIEKEYEKERQATQVKEQTAAQRAYYIGEYMKQGLTEQEAVECFNMVSQPGSFTPDKHVNYYKGVLKNQPNAQNELKINQLKSREEKEKFVLPPNLIGGEQSKDKQKTPDDDFNETTFRKSAVRSI